MTEYIIRPPRKTDIGSLTELLYDDYDRVGLHGGHAVSALNRSFEEGTSYLYKTAIHPETRNAEALTKRGPWRWGDEAPYRMGRKLTTKILDIIKAFDDVGGIHVMSAVSYEQGGALDQLASAERLFTRPRGPLNIAIPEHDEEVADYLKDKGFEPTRRAEQPYPYLGEAAFVLMQKKIRETNVLPGSRWYYNPDEAH